VSYSHSEFVQQVFGPILACPSTEFYRVLIDNTSINEAKGTEKYDLGEPVYLTGRLLAGKVGGAIQVGAFHLTTNNLNEKDIEQFYQFIGIDDKAQTDIASLARVLYAHEMHGVTPFNAPAPTIIPELVETAIEKYNKQMQQTLDAKEKQQHIEELIWELIHIHPFKNGNLIIFAVILKNILFLQHGLGLCTQEDLDRYNGWSLEELHVDSQQSFKKMQQLQKEKTGDFLGFSTAKMEEREQHTLRRMAQGVIRLAEERLSPLSPLERLNRDIQNSDWDACSMIYLILKQN
jgi:hypothetical protein